MKPTNYLVVISVDALNKHDYNYIQTLPNFKSFIDEGAHSKDVVSVYPTVTYTCHTSMATGHLPHIHGIYNNELAQPHKPATQDWRWFEKDIKSPTFFDYARQSGLTTCTVLWPVMAGADVTYNVPEIWSPDHTKNGLGLFFNHGTKNVLWPVIKYSRLLKGTSQPYLDNFTEAVSLHILKKKKPNIMAIHFTDLDTMRHLHGLHSNEAKEALTRIDKRIGHIIDLYKEIGLFDNTNFVLFGDHGTHDFDKVIELNSYLRENNLLETDSEGNITHWKAYGCTCGGSVHVHLSNDADEDSKERLQIVMDKLSVMPKSPIKHIFTRDEVKEQHGLDGDFEYVLEAKDGHIFKNTISGKFLHNSNENPKTYLGQHGYLPSHPDQRTLLLMKGPSIKSGISIDHSRLIDEGPTLAALLGLTMEKTEGKVLSALLAD